MIADGMGGTTPAKLRRASRSTLWYVRQRSANLARERRPEYWPFGFDPSLSADGDLLRTAILLANVQIREAAIASNDYAGMGTTIVAARVTDGRLSIAHVGDSRLYLFRGGALRQLTQDDSWMASMLEHDPNADPLLLEHHPMRNALTNVVGARARTEVHVAEEMLTGGAAAAVDRRRPRYARRPSDRTDAGGRRRPARDRAG